METQAEYKVKWEIGFKPTYHKLVISVDVTDLSYDQAENLVDDLAAWLQAYRDGILPALAPELRVQEATNG